jgi:hypothetical protein
MRINVKKFVDLTCARCHQQFKKESKEYDRRVKKGNNIFYCSLDCFHHNKLDEFSPFKGFICAARKGSIAKKLKFNLNVEYLKSLWDKQNGICPYTKYQMVLPPHAKAREFIPLTASLDRIDSGKGYIKGNVEFVCLAVNYAKNEFSRQQMLDFFHQ